MPLRLEVVCSLDMKRYSAMLDRAVSGLVSMLEKEEVELGI
jgi:hypothetical protein